MQKGDEMETTKLDRRSIDHVLATTRAVRRRLDLERPVPLEVVRECLELALQAPTGFNQQNWRWLVVTDPEKRQAIAEIFRRVERPFMDMMEQSIRNGDEETRKVATSSWYLAEHLHEVPVHVIPCSISRIDGVRAMFGSLGYETDLENMAASAIYGELWPAAWSFMLALRSRGLGSAWTTLHLPFEREAEELLGIPDTVTQVALLPVGFYTGTSFTPAARRPAREITYANRWKQTV